MANTKPNISIYIYIYIERERESKLVVQEGFVSIYRCLL